MFRICYVLLAIAIALSTAHASDRQLDLTTSDGRLIKLDIYNPNADRVVLLAPGQGCNPRLEMYDTLANEARTKNITLVRMYWAYCVADPAKGKPADDLSLEKRTSTPLLNMSVHLGWTTAKSLLAENLSAASSASKFFAVRLSYPD